MGGYWIGWPVSKTFGGPVSSHEIGDTAGFVISPYHSFCGLFGQGLKAKHD
jgi:hypothetical protein